MSGEIETKQEDDDEAKITRRWLREIELAGQHESKWRERAEKVIERYRDEKTGENESRKPRFNILYANTEVLRGVVYQKPPVPDVRRRFLDRDPVGKEAAQVLQRALSFCADAYDMDAVMNAVVEDTILPGRAFAKVRYVPTYGPMMGQDGQPVLDEQGQPVQQVVYETVETDYVEWDMVRLSPAKRWSKVRWVAFGELLTRDELVQQFGDLGRTCELHWSPKDKEDAEDMFKRALVWSIWDKTSRKVHVVSEGMKGQRLAVQDDPLNLEGFFPCPRPVYSVSTTNKMIPIPEFTQYQDQAAELDDLTGRISVLVNALRRRGVFDANYKELEKLATAGDNEFVAVENFVNLAEKGGINAALMESPIDNISKTLMSLYDQRERVKQTIYEITGIADVVRGVSAASETLGAQQLKARYANSRIGTRQKAIQVFARDLMRLKAEIISEKFSPQTLAMMTGFELPWSESEKAAISQARPDDPMLKKPSWEAVIKLLRDDKLRGFRVDIETDSTVQPDAAEEQKNRVELLSAVTSFITGIGPAVQSGAVPMPVAKEMLSFGVRGFKVSPSLEDALDEIGGEQKADPIKEQSKQAAVAKEAAAVQIAKANAQKAMAEAREAEAKAQMAERKLSFGVEPELGLRGVI